MAELQTTYGDTVAKGYPGMVADGEVSNRISRTIEDVAGVGFGRPVYRGVLDHGCTANVGTLATFYGITVATGALALLPGATADLYVQNDNVTILTSGAIFVTVTGTVNDGAAISFGTGAGAADGYSAIAADATHVATGFIADETVTTGLCRIVKR